jgi:hypothetical protein
LKSPIQPDQREKATMNDMSWLKASSRENCIAFISAIQYEQLTTFWLLLMMTLIFLISKD